MNRPNVESGSKLDCAYITLDALRRGLTHVAGIGLAAYHAQGSLESRLEYYARELPVAAQRVLDLGGSL